jgi:FkbM family methyltransferase
MLLKTAKTMRQVAYQLRQIQERRTLLSTRFGSAIASITRLNLLPDRYLPNPISLLGYRVSYADAHQLREFFREIFVRANYMFHSNERRPFILDCGSNIGMAILFFKRVYPGSSIIGFEPDPDTFAILQRNVAQNGLTDVTVLNCALSDRDGTVGFYKWSQRKSPGQMSILPERGGDVRIDVPARRLSSLITGDVDLLKMDIEGAERLVLPELAAANALRRIRQIHLEYHHHLQHEVDNFSETLRLLEQNDFGYQIQASSPNWSTGRQVQYVGIYAYRKSDAGIDGAGLAQPRETNPAVGAG